MAEQDWGGIYKELGAKPIINAIGSVTLLGGSTPIPEVKAAMERADEAYIPLMELEEKAGDAVAKYGQRSGCLHHFRSRVRANPGHRGAHGR